MTVGAGAVAVAALARALPLPRVVSPLVALRRRGGRGRRRGRLDRTSGASGARCSAWRPGRARSSGCGSPATTIPSRFVHMTAGVALPLTLATRGPWLLGRALM